MIKKDKKDNNEKNSQINIADYPEKYLEINILNKDNFRLINTIYEFVSRKTFDYDGKKYNIDSKAIFIIPNRKSFTQTSYYIEGNPDPITFSESNEGIPCNALSLLWNYKLYKILMEFDTKNINYILIILLIVSMIMYGIGIYYHANGGFM